MEGFRGQTYGRLYVRMIAPADAACQRPNAHPADGENPRGSPTRGRADFSGERHQRAAAFSAEIRGELRWHEPLLRRAGIRAESSCKQIT
jgi:hypothetical protein